ASAYVACFRNYSATVDYLAQNHDAVVLIGAGTRGDFREEDQMCCAWIAQGLIESGFVPDNGTTRELVERWDGAPKDAFIKSRSVDYLRRSGQLRDLEFILSHFDDIDTACKLSNDEVCSVTVRAEVYMKLIDTSLPVLVLQMDHYGALGVMRSLGRLGVRVYGVHTTRWPVAAFSRYCRKVFQLDIDRIPAQEAV